MYLQEYQNAFDVAFSLLYSLQNAQEEKLVKTAQDSVVAIIRAEIKKWISLEDIDEDLKPIANKFLRNIKDFANQYSLKEDILNVRNKAYMHYVNNDKVVGSH